MVQGVSTVKEVKNALLSPGEWIMEEITATLEVNGTFGTDYTFGSLIATNERLRLYTKYPFFGVKETAVYHYCELNRIEIGKRLFSFHDDISIVVKLVNKGNVNHFLETIQLYSTVPGIRNFHQNNSGS